MLKTVGFPSTRTGDQTIVNGNLVIGTAGKGIDFSINPNPGGMTSELLNDYEEGTWTPAIAFGGATTGITYTQQLGSYVKIGKLVTISFEITLSSKGSATGPLTVTGSPFTRSGARTAGTLSYITGTLPYSVPVVFYPNAAGVLTFNPGATGGLTDAQFTDTSAIIGSISYLT